MNIVSEIREFLRGLQGEAPELFGRASKPHDPASADAAIHERVEYWAVRMGVVYNHVRVKQQRTRWGSCSEKRNLNLNRRLLLAPPEVLDYVVIHELAHLREMNHSQRFWLIVEAYCPDQKVHRRWLRKNGPALMRKRKIVPKVAASACRIDPPL